jgi:hypothetical protein
MPPRLGNAPWVMAVSGSCPNGAPHEKSSGLLRAASSRRRPSRARWTGSAAANSPARRVAREFMPNTEPMAARPASSHRVNRPPGAGWSPRAASPPAARQLPRGQRRWPRRSGRPHWERARARACRLAAGASRPSHGEAAAAVELKNPNWHALSPLRLLGGGWRAAHPLTLTPTLTLFLFLTLTPFPDPDPVS